MSTGSKVVRGAGLLTVARVTAYGLSFLRNLLVARLLTKADFGLASLFAVTLSMLDFTSRMSLGSQVVQSKAGHTAVFRDTCHAMQAVLGVASALLMLILARPAALLCGVPWATWAFAVLAVGPLLHGLVHLDNSVRQRRLEYKPAVICDLVPQLVITAAAWPLSLWLKDFRVMLCLELGRLGLMAALTHITAGSRYRWSWDTAHLRSMFAFGWPLLFSGALLTLSQQADRIVVSRFYSLNELAEYSLAFSLLTVPFLIFAQVASSTMLPVLSRSQDNLGRFVRDYRICLECAALLAVGMVVPFTAMGDPIITFLYGAKYSGTGAILAVLGIATAFRLLRAATAVAAMALGDTRNQLSSNVARIAGLVMAVLLAARGKSVLLVGAAAVCGEAVALLVSILRLERKQGVRASFGFTAALFVAGSSLASGCIRFLLPEDLGLALSAVVMLALMALLSCLGFLVFADTSRVAWHNVAELWSRRSNAAGVAS